MAWCSLMSAKQQLIRKRDLTYCLCSISILLNRYKCTVHNAHWRVQYWGKKCMAIIILRKKKKKELKPRGGHHCLAVSDVWRDTNQHLISSRQKSRIWTITFRSFCRKQYSIYLLQGTKSMRQSTVSLP